MAFDIHIEGVPADAVKGTKAISFGDYGRVYAVQGIQKMVDRYLKCLMTPVGTDISDPNYGTGLPAMFLGNVDDATVRQMSALAVSDAETKIRSYDTQNEAPEDEKLVGATMESFSFDEANRGIEMVVLLKNAAGTTVRVRVPDLENYTG